MSDESVDIVVFEVGGTRYGVDLTQVLRVSRAQMVLEHHPLGRPREGRRALVYSREGSEQMLPIDAIYGVKTVPLTHLRRLPPVVTGSRLPLGAWLDGEDTVLLLDLNAIQPSLDGS